MANRVKITRLDEIELARVGMLPREQKKQALRRGKSGHPPYYLNAVRAHFMDILGLPMSRVAWTKIRASIRKACRHSTAERIANVQLGRGLYLFVDEHDVKGRPADFAPLSLGLSGDALTYWCRAILEIDGHPYVAFIDPRQSHGVTRKSLRFVFSMMHTAIREGRGDLAAVRFVVIKFGPTVKGARKVRLLFEPDDIELIDHKTLSADVRETYQVWEQVLQERAAKKRAA